MNQTLNAIISACMLTLVSCADPTPIPVTFSGRPLSVEGGYGSVQHMALVLENDGKREALLFGAVLIFD